MEQLVIDISSSEDAHLIKELLKRFKKVEVKSFSSDVALKEMQFRLQQGLRDADSGSVKSWNSIKESLTNKIKSHKNK